MGIKFGDVDATQILINEFSIVVLDEVLDWIMNNNPSLKKPDAKVINEIKKSVLKQLKAKYPNSGLELKGES